MCNKEVKTFRRCDHLLNASEDGITVKEQNDKNKKYRLQGSDVGIIDLDDLNALDHVASALDAFTCSYLHVLES
jgi:hypothetical protein